MSARWPTLLGIALALAWATPLPADIIPGPAPSPTVTNPQPSPVSSNSGGYSYPGGSQLFDSLIVPPARSNACGALGAATVSILLTVGGCWFVRNRHRHCR